MKSIIKTMIVVYITILLTGSALNVQASEKKYCSIDSANFDIQLLENGDANITETWTVDYEGKYSRFYKDIHSGSLTTAEKYTDSKFNYLTINGVECAYAEDLDAREDYTYSIVNQGGNTTINWYYNVEDDEVTYEANYTIENIVKETVANQAVFCYRLIGKDFTKEIDNVSIKISTYNNQPVDLYYTNKENSIAISTDNNGTLYIDSTKASSGLFRVIATTNIDVFTIETDRLTYITTQELEEATKDIVVKDKSSDDGYSDFTAITMIIMLIVFFLASIIASSKSTGGKPRIGDNNNDSGCSSCSDCSSCSSCSSCGGCGGGGAD